MKELPIPSGDRVVGVIEPIELRGRMRSKHQPGEIMLTNRAMQGLLERKLPDSVVDLTPTKLSAAVKYALKTGGKG